MKIVKTPEFLLCSPGTLYSRYDGREPLVLKIKGTTIAVKGSDKRVYETRNLVTLPTEFQSDALKYHEATGASFTPDVQSPPYLMRYDESDVQFAIFDVDDVLSIARRLMTDLQQCATDPTDRDKVAAFCLLGDTR